MEQRELQQLVREVGEALRAQDWLSAAEKFDAAWSKASEQDDPLMEGSGAEPRALAAGETISLAGGTGTLEALYRSAPDDFRKTWQEQFGAVAELRIRESMQAGDPAAVKANCVRYSFSKAAEEGLRYLVRRSLDRGQTLDAALLLGRLDRFSDRPDPQLKMQMAVCCARAGLIADAEEILTVLDPVVLQRWNVVATDEAPDQIPARISEWVRMTASDSRTAVSGWLQPGGSFRRTELQARTSGGLQESWTSDLFQVNDVLYADDYNPALAAARGPLERNLEHLLQNNGVAVSTVSPLVTDGLAILRTPFGLRAINIESGELAWEVTRPDSGIRTLLENTEGSRRSRARQWNPQFYELSQELLQQVIRTNPASQMSISGNTLFVVDECSGTTWGNRTSLILGNAPPGTIRANYIRAYDVRSGLFLWEIGGQTQSRSRPGAPGNVLAGHYFLGAPMVLGQRVYVLAENGEALTLIQIRPPASRFADANPSIERSQILAVPEVRLPGHAVRKHAGLIPSFAQGMLICPTCDQSLVAVSADDHSIRWMFRYPGNTRTQDLGGSDQVLAGGFDAMDSNRVDMDSRWTDSLPRIVAGRVLVTPRDADQIFCLELSTGRQIWSAPRSAFHAIAATTDELVVLAGNQRLAGLNLADGKEVWSTELSNGIVCGRAVTDGDVLQVPLSTPAILSLDLQTGRRLVEQPVAGPALPFNLLVRDTGLLCQSPTSAIWMARRTENLSESERATDLLLRNERLAARDLLLQSAGTSEADRNSRDLLIRILLDDLRSDFSAHRQTIPRLQELIDQASEDVDIAPLLHSLIGLNPADLPVLARQTHTRSESFQSELSEIFLNAVSSQADLGQQEIVKILQSLIQELPDSQSQVVSSGFLSRRKCGMIVRGIRRAIQRRSPAEQAAIAAEMAATVRETAELLPADESRIGFLNDIALCGLGPAALDSLKSEGDEFWKHRARLLAEQTTLELFRAGTGVMAAKTLLDQWKSQGNWSALRAMASDLASRSERPGDMRFFTPNPELAMQIQTAAELSIRDLTGADQPQWQGKPVVSSSDHTSVAGRAAKPDFVPERFVPLYGSPGIFRGWSFALAGTLTGSNVLGAFDPDGFLKWKVTLPLIEADRLPGRGSDVQEKAYATTCGSLLAFRINSAVMVVDASASDAAGEPRILWREDLELITDAENEFRNYVPGPDRLHQYFPQPSGFFPAGPLTAAGLPLITGQRLMVVDPLTGAWKWHVDGIPRDAVLLCHDQNVLILSETTRQIESRSLIDGTVESIARLPEWWGYAISNVGSSVREIELEQGVETVWRVLVHGRSCLLFRLTDGKSVLEDRDLPTDTVNWSVELPENTVFSNPVEDVVALLSDGHRLKLVQADTGRILLDSEVAPVKDPRELLLRETAGGFVVMPEAVEDPSLELNPVNQAHHVFGRMYGVRRSDWTLAWDRPMDHRHIRFMIPERLPFLPNAPVLVLLDRGQTVAERNYRVLVIDPRTGEDVFSDDNVGLTLNEHWLQIDAEKQVLTLSFEARTVKMEYRPPAAKP